LDELFGLIRAVEQDEMERQEAIEQLDRPWLWVAMDPVSKFWLATELGPRTSALAQRLVHQVVRRLKVDQLPLFMTDGWGAYETALLTHYGQWRAPEPGSRQRQARWWPLPKLQYVQVIKKRARRRLVSVTRRVVFGSRDLIRQQLAAYGWQINPAFIERLNLSIRQHVPGLGRRVNTLTRSADGLAQQVGLYQVYYNFCLPHASLKVAGENERSRQKGQPTLARGGRRPDRSPVVLGGGLGFPGATLASARGSLGGVSYCLRLFSPVPGEKYRAKEGTRGLDPAKNRPFSRLVSQIWLLR